MKAKIPEFVAAMVVGAMCVAVFGSLVCIAVPKLAMWAVGADFDARLVTWPCLTLVFGYATAHEWGTTRKDSEVREVHAQFRGERAKYDRLMLAVKRLVALCERRGVEATTTVGAKMLIAEMEKES